MQQGDVDLSWKSEEVYPTQTYAAKDFSAEEWDDPERDAKLKSDEEMITNGPSPKA